MTAYATKADKLTASCKGLFILVLSSYLLLNVSCAELPLTAGCDDGETSLCIFRLEISCNYFRRVMIGAAI
jgi:hypothetical protein